MQLLNLKSKSTGITSFTSIFMIMIVSHASLLVDYLKVKYYQFSTNPYEIGSDLMKCYILSLKVLQQYYGANAPSAHTEMRNTHRML